MQLSLSCGNIWRRKRPRVQSGIVHEPLWRQFSNLNLVRQAKLKHPVTGRKHCAGGRVVMSSTNSGGENRESHSSETPDPFSPFIIKRT